MSPDQIFGVVVLSGVVALIAFLFGHWLGSLEAKSYKALEEIAASWRDKALKLKAKIRKLKKQLQRIAKDL